MDFIHEDFLLHSKTARKLYHDYAEPEPILDYHSHLSAQDIATNRKFANLFEIWLAGDHYKWRAMRANGIAERFCTGDAAPYEKFLAWARTVPFTLRNPLYHWTHFELKRYFGISDLLSEQNAKLIWDRANSLLQTDGLSTQGILRKFTVRAVCTSDDPCDDLSFHNQINKHSLGFRVYPTFRPDKALRVDDSEVFLPWLNRLGEAANTDISTFNGFLEALTKRHDAFHAVGCRLSDHGLNRCYANPCNEARASAIYDFARTSKAVARPDQEQFASFLMVFFGRLDAGKGWTKQLHLGALRNTSSRGLEALGPDTGFDSTGDWPQATALCSYLDLLDKQNALPKTIVYNLNPADNYVFASAIGNFQDGSIAGKIQFGSGWWFLDQKEAIEWQLNALSNNGLLSRFVGMLTDSRSFMSFPRHEYFRRVLCNLCGAEMERGDLPNEEELVGRMIRNICFANAESYLGLSLPSSSEVKSASA
ncbi:MAG TPA: glucuronate isomerase [Candidatus Acidoferrum sp.]|nr:glucuronate isomerase [Candidatus Acidoferrum sp.]